MVPRPKNRSKMSNKSVFRYFTCTRKSEKRAWPCGGSHCSQWERPNKHGFLCIFCGFAGFHATGFAGFIWFPVGFHGILQGFSRLGKFCRLVLFFCKLFFYFPVFHITGANAVLYGKLIKWKLNKNLL